LNGYIWAPGTTTAYPGYYLGASSPNTLNFFAFYLLPNAISDSLTNLELNTEYASAQQGQSVIGPDVIYQYIGSRYLGEISYYPDLTKLNMVNGVAEGMYLAFISSWYVDRESFLVSLWL